MPLDVFTSADADSEALAGSTVAVIGYGNLGSSMAANLAASGVTVVVGNRDDEYRAAAAAAGFPVADIGDAVARADIVYVLISDEAIPACFSDFIAPALRPGSAVCFASGYCLAYGLVTPPPDVDVLLLAPRMVGSAVARGGAGGAGFVAYANVERDASGRARQRLLGLAAATGALDRGAFVLPAVDEAALDLFVEQTVGPVVGLALQLAFEVGVAAGLAPSRSCSSCTSRVRWPRCSAASPNAASTAPSSNTVRQRSTAAICAPSTSTSRRCGRASSPCSTTSVPAGSPGRSRPRPRPAPRPSN